MKAKIEIQIPINDLPTYLDGSGGSMWQSRDVWPEILAKPTEDIAARRYVRVSDVIVLLAHHGVKFVLVAADSSNHGTIIESK